MIRSFLTELYWSRLGFPIRLVLPRNVPPSSDARYWDSLVSGIFAPRPSMKTILAFILFAIALVVLWPFIRLPREEEDNG